MTLVILDIITGVAVVYDRVFNDSKLNIFDFWIVFCFI